MNQFKHAKWWRSYLDKLKQAFSYTKASQQKEKSKEKQREAKRSKEENRGQQLQSSLALLEHFPKSIFYMLYTISKLRKSRIQRFKPCMIWSWNEEDIAFGSQLLQACAKISHTPGAVVFRRPYLPHFSSKSYTVWSVGFLTSWDLKWYIVCTKWTSGSAPKVHKKTIVAVLYFLHSVFPLSLLLSLHTLNDFGKGLWGSKAWFLHEFELPKALP